MKRYKRYFEMANISVKYSGIIEGVIQIRPEERHINFPHIHYVHNVKKADTEFIKFSISSEKDKIAIIEQTNFKISSKEKDKVVKFIYLNSDKLTKYYKQAELLDTADFILSLQKV